MQLLRRVRRRIVLIEHGVEYAGRICHHLDQIEKDTFGLVSRTGMGRSIHIAVVPTLATTWLILRLSGFQQPHPDISVSLSVRTLPFQFKDRPFASALYHAGSLWAGTQGVLLSPKKELVLVCVAHLLRREEDGLTGLTHLHLRSRPDAWRLWYAANDWSCGPLAAGGSRYELFMMMLAAVEAGLGVGLALHFLAYPALTADRLVQPGPQMLSGGQSYYFGYSQCDERSETLKVFERWLRSVA